TAAIRSGATVNAGAGDVSMSAASTSTSTVKALGGTIGGSSFGLGISFALSIVNDHTFAGIQGTGVLTNAHDLTLHANGQHAMTTESRTGAAGPIAIVPSIAISLSNVDSRANIGTGSLLTLAGKLDAKAELTASAISTAAGAATGGSSAAIGVSLGLTVANHTVESTTHRNITATGSGSFQPLGTPAPSASGAKGTAPPAGAPAQGSAGEHAGGVDGQVAEQRSHADTVAGPGHGSGGTSTPSASTSSGGVSVAAAVGINIANSSSRA